MGLRIESLKLLESMRAWETHVAVKGKPKSVEAIMVSDRSTLGNYPVLGSGAYNRPRPANGNVGTDETRSGMFAIKVK